MSDGNIKQIVHINVSRDGLYEILGKYGKCMHRFNTYDPVRYPECVREAIEQSAVSDPNTAVGEIVKVDISRHGSHEISNKYINCMRRTTGHTGLAYNYDAKIYKRCLKKAFE